MPYDQKTLAIHPCAAMPVSYTHLEAIVTTSDHKHIFLKRLFIFFIFVFQFSD